MSDRLVVIDFASVFYPVWHMAGSQPDVNAASIEVVAKVRALASAHPHVAICCDSGKSFRAEISADYKANRPESDATLQHQISLAVDTLRGDGFPIWAARGFEADDLIATAVAAANPPDTEGADVLIISADKDLLQLVSDRVQVFRPALGTAAERTYDAAAVVEKFGIHPTQFCDFLALVGDKSDNIRGADRIGAVTAAKLLTTYGTLEDLWAAIEKGEASLTPAIGKSLIDFFAGSPSRCDVARSLIRLKTDAPIPFAEIFNARVPADAAAFSGEDDIAFALPTLAPEDMHHENVGRPESAGDDRADGAERRDGGGDGPGDAGGGPLAPGVQSPRTAEDANGHPRDTPRAMARRDPGAAAIAFERQLEPQDIVQAKELATWMFQSRLFSAYGTPQAVLATVLAGRELGFQAMASLRAFHILDGRPTLSAGAIHALILQSGQAKYFRCTERTADHATFVTQRGDDPPVSLTFTIEDARQAWTKELTKFAQSGWGKNPADMCVARALTKLARLVYPDIVSGLYASEEFDQ
jgi:5'-3' exonuclease